MLSDNLYDTRTERAYPNGDHGLVLDEQNRVVMRRGKTGQVELARHPVLWGVLKVLLAQHGGYCSAHAFRQAWGDFGRTDEPEDGTIHSVISHLRRFLLPLGVAIDNAPGDGWRLIDIEHASR